MTFSLRQIQYFIAVAEAGTISGAASRLSISQSTITEAIKELEADLGLLPCHQQRARRIDAAAVGDLVPSGKASPTLGKHALNALHEVGLEAEGTLDPFPLHEAAGER
mgnify:CR=1 FL=1